MITVGIYTFNRHQLLQGAIESVLPQLRSLGEGRSLVVDNSSDTHAAAACREKTQVLDSRIRYVVMPPLGLSGARNEACSRCDTPLIAFIDDGARVLPGWLDAIVSCFGELPPRTAAVGGPVLLDWAAGRPAWLADILPAYLSALDLGERARTLDEAEWVVGTNMAFRARALRDAGGFNTELGRRSHAMMGNEEIDVIRRLRAAGFNASYNPAMRVRHLVSPERVTQDWFRHHFFWQAVSDIVMDTAGRPPDRNNWFFSSHSTNDPLSLLPRELTLDTEDPDAFVRQCFQIHECARALSGACRVDAGCS